MFRSNDKKLLIALSLIVVLLLIANIKVVITLLGVSIAFIGGIAFLLALAVKEFFVDPHPPFWKTLVFCLSIFLIGLAVIHLSVFLFYRLLPKSLIEKYRARNSDIEIFLDLLELENDGLIDAGKDELITYCEKILDPAYSLTWELISTKYGKRELRQMRFDANATLGRIFSSAEKFDFERAKKFLLASTRVKVFNKSIWLEDFLSFKAKNKMLINLGMLYFYGNPNDSAKKHVDYGKAVTYLLAARDHDPELVDFLVGTTYYDGFIIEERRFFRKTYLHNGTGSVDDTRNKAVAFEKFKSAKSKQPMALKRYALMSFNGEGCEINYTEAFKALKEYYELQGSLDLDSALLADMYEFGKGTEQNLKEALVWFLVANKLFNSAPNPDGFDEQVQRVSNQIDTENVAQAYFIAGCLLPSESGIDYLNHSHDMGCLDATHELALQFDAEIGDTAHMNSSKAFELAKLLVDRFDPRGFNLLAILYRGGHGTERNVPEAIRLYKIGVEQYNDPFCAFNLAETYNSSEFGVLSETLHFEYLTLAARLGHYYAKKRLAEYYFSKEPLTSKDLCEEVLNSPDLGLIADAAFMLGKLYYYQKIPITYIADAHSSFYSYRFASENFRYATRLGNSDSLVYLGHLYYFGLGTTVDYFKAYKLLEASLEKSSLSSAPRLLGMMNVLAQGRPQNLEKGVYFLEDAALKGNPDATLFLAKYYKGDLVPASRDLVQALKWLYFAADKEFPGVYEEMKPIKDLLSSEGIAKARALANTLVT
jgi:TPR repeat protein